MATGGRSNARFVNYIVAQTLWSTAGGLVPPDAGGKIRRYNVTTFFATGPPWLSESPKFCSEFQKKAVCAEVTQGAHFPHLSEEEKLNRIVLLR